MFLDDIKLFAAVFMEKEARKIKSGLLRRRLEVFLSRYSLHDGIRKPKTDVRFNPYEGTPLCLIDELIKSGEIQKGDYILDVGCGAGIFMIYLSSNGFEHVKGVEFDGDLYSLCRENISAYMNNGDYRGCEIEVEYNNALIYDIDDNTNIFYIFNTFYDKETYDKWLIKVSQSLERKERRVKIIILYPTVASMGAMRACGWLQEKCRVLCKAQNCYQCMNAIIYENRTHFDNQQ